LCSYGEVSDGVPGYDPIRLPPGFWTEPAVRAALRARDLGRLFKIMGNLRPRISQTRIGVALGKDQGQISRMVNHTKDNTLRVFIEVADGLNMPQSARYDLLHDMLGAQPSRVRSRHLIRLSASVTRRATSQTAPASPSYFASTSTAVLS
jgi:hypothetical protein